MQTLATQTTPAARRSAARGQIPHSVRTLAERSSPTEIRVDVQKLLSQGQNELAQALGDAALSLYPENEEIIGICALLGMSRGDWEEAVELLRQLQGIQKEASPATTYWLLARCLRCTGQETEAVATLEAGLFAHPTSTELQTELSILLKR